MSIGGQSDARSERKVVRLTPEGFAKKEGATGLLAQCEAKRNC